MTNEVLRTYGALLASRIALLALALALVLSACGGAGGVRTHAGREGDTAFVAMQARGQIVMGVDQYTSTHIFEDLPDGGRIVLDRDSGLDAAGIVAIRQHMRDIAAAFRAGAFTQPFQVHAQVVPGTSVMAARRARITYDAIDRPHGAEVRIHTTDSAAVAAVHEFLAFQRTAHHAARHEGTPSSDH